MDFITYYNIEPMKLVSLVAMILLLTGCATRSKRTEVPTTEPPHVHVHKEVEIPTPVAILEQRPLDLIQHCPAEGICSLLLLYSDRLEIVDWKEDRRNTIVLPATLKAAVRSRSLSGKLLRVYSADMSSAIRLEPFAGSNLYYVASVNDWESPVYFDQDLKGPFPFNCTTCFLPVAEIGTNYFSLNEGYFFDFDFATQNRFVAVTTKNQLGVQENTVIAFAEGIVGSSLAQNLPVIYTSAPVLEDEQDQIRKYVYEEGVLRLAEERNSHGPIFDLYLSDLNRDQQVELLVTVKGKTGFYVEVHEPF